MNSWVRQLPAEYRRKVTNIDREFYGSVLGEWGCCRSTWRAWASCSADLEGLICAIADSRVLFLSQERERPLSDKEAGHILSQHRRVPNVVFVCVQATCLVARMGHLGKAAQGCAARRDNTKAEAKRLREEALAFHSAHMQGRG
jgi:hypothetical protein